MWRSGWRAVVERGVELSGDDHQPADEHQLKEQRRRDPERAVCVGSALD
jgi:hypothetical protein